MRNFIILVIVLSVTTAAVVEDLDSIHKENIHFERPLGLAHDESGLSRPNGMGIEGFDTSTQTSIGNIDSINSKFHQGIGFGSPGISGFGSPAIVDFFPLSFGNPVSGGFGRPFAGGFGRPFAGGFRRPSVGGFGRPFAGGFGSPFAGGFGIPFVGGFGSPFAGGFGSPFIGGFGRPLAGGFGRPQFGGFGGSSLVGTGGFGRPPLGGFVGSGRPLIVGGFGGPFGNQGIGFGGVRPFSQAPSGISPPVVNNANLVTGTVSSTPGTSLING